MKRLLILAGTFALAACGAAPVKPLPPYYTAVNVEHPRYPHARFMTGEGSSTLSADEADARAKANIGTQISARVGSELISFQEYTSKTGQTAENVRSTVSVKSEFDRADLIAIAERENQGETFHSFAVLDRAAADHELADGSAADLTSFESAAALALKARKERDAGVFASAATEAARLRSALDSNFVLRRAVAGHAAAKEIEYVERRGELLVALEEARAHRVIGVVFTQAAGIHLGDLAINAVKHIGLRPDSVACKDRDEKTRTDATELSVEPEETCMEGSLGEKCEVVIHLVAQACGGTTSGAGTVAQVRGVHPSDREKARKSAWDKVTQQAVEAAVRDALRSAIVIGAEAQ